MEYDGLVQMEPEAKTQGSSIAASVFNLTNTIIGAGGVWPAALALGSSRRSVHASCACSGQDSSMHVAPACI